MQPMGYAAFSPNRTLVVIADKGTLTLRDANTGKPIGPDGGAGSLEAYIGVPALMRQYGSMDAFFGRLQIMDAPMQALARAIRICHAIYRPQQKMQFKVVRADKKSAPGASDPVATIAKQKRGAK